MHEKPDDPIYLSIGYINLAHGITVFQSWIHSQNHTHAQETTFHLIQLETMLELSKHDTKPTAFNYQAASFMSAIIFL